MAHELSDQGRLGLARMHVQFLFEAMEQDAHPDESVEGCFGVKMGDALGKVVLGAWISLVKHMGVATHENITAALVAGSLPLSTMSPALGVNPAKGGWWVGFQRT